MGDTSGNDQIRNTVKTFEKQSGHRQMLAEGILDILLLNFACFAAAWKIQHKMPEKPNENDFKKLLLYLQFM